MSEVHALLIVDHGSRKQSANDMLACVVAAVANEAHKNRGTATVPRYFRGAHMELASPSIDEAMRELAGLGVTNVRAVPLMLGPGRHATEDIPRLVAASAAEHGMRVSSAPPLGVHRLLAQLLLLRAGLSPEHGEAECGLGACKEGGTKGCGRADCPHLSAE